MVKRIGKDFCAYCFYSYTSLGDQVIALNSQGVSLILGSLVGVHTNKIPNSKNQLFEVIKIDLDKGITVRDLENKNTYILDTNEIIIF